MMRTIPTIHSINNIKLQKEEKDHSSNIKTRPTQIQQQTHNKTEQTNPTKGKALDMLEAGPVEKFNGSIIGTSNYEDISTIFNA